ncbi:serine protease [Ruegeria sp. Ofav3-42]|uniref:S1 family peptidase n=1 Tax=Ruegeria sp. Ofav3-42 TaxID=2917759 RepID=UPI001EF7385B|nr:serine protease [Ruegeria sp. Ofav3-42]MCG7521927.1 serine protease [Ruegeria sp. Ofav3-42]
MRLVGSLILIVASALGAAATAQDMEALRTTTVAIFCTKSDGSSVQGSGVLVSDDGHVLTAAHVVAGTTGTAREVPDIPNDVTCKGSIGVVDPNNAQPMIVQPHRFTVDAVLLKFVVPPVSGFQKACADNDTVIGRDIFAAAFRGTSNTSQVSFIGGAISTNQPDRYGVIETTAPTLRGMSGGPVFSRNGAGLVGIVGGAEFQEADGSASYYGVVSIDLVATATFSLEDSDRPCFPTRTELVSWQTGKEPVKLDMRVDEGYCSVQSVFGQFNEVEDRVEIIEAGDHYYLQGSAGDLGGTHGASAICFPFN